MASALSTASALETPEILKTSLHQIPFPAYKVSLLPSMGLKENQKPVSTVPDAHPTLKPADSMVKIIHQFAEIDFDQPGKNHYQVAFHRDGSWGYSLVPLTVINGLRGSNGEGVLCFGGTHGNEYEGTGSA